MLTKTTHPFPDPPDAGFAPLRPISTARRHRPPRMRPQARRRGPFAPRRVATAFELAPRSAICDRFRPSFCICVLCSHVARRRPAREHRRPRARSRRVGGAHDVQLDGAAASRHAEPSSRSPVPVPAAHGALGMCLDDTRLRRWFRGRIAAEGPIGGGSLRALSVYMF